ncbi:uncharacterized protein LOC129579058 isoform X1 [Sitodiplosis mosellana]|uniref:uncharacterized protein LOC129579058 isoform X1 n=1 Tax=Sitodiplosis mosellana TaxID=263140 RepID=UPI0024443F0F|nr:uncharacterized protein LOC129579058 isoform X1 [Sitodiplosis mosellana]XP_055324557.1 uncharacterized protein LOC129579058 isoform X1 [Sitodiplosis mosellana]
MNINHFVNAYKRGTKMMRISNKQRAIINTAVKPFKITSNYLGPGFQNLIKYYAKYFTKRRFAIVHFLPTYKKLNSHILTVLFNKILTKGGYAKKRRPVTWRFYGNVLLTKYGRRKQRREQKKKRKKARRQKSSTPSKDTKPKTTGPTADTSTAPHLVVTDIDTDSNENSNDDVIEIISKPAEARKNGTEAPNKPNANDVEANKDKIISSDEIVDNIWDLDIQEVAALITEGETDEKQPTESTNRDAEEEDDSSEISAALESSRDSERVNCVDEESQEQSSKSSGGDINEKIRQQLKLLKMGKGDNPLFSMKETRPATCTRGTISSFRRSNSNVSDESATNSMSLRRSTNNVSAKSSTESFDSSPKESDDADAAKKSNEKEESKKSKAIGGMINSLFNKFQSINSNMSTRSKTRGTNSPAANTSTPAKRTKRDETNDSLLYASLDSNQDDSNQSATSVSMEFLGFDILNKNVDVSALLPTPKVPASNNQAAFVSEFLDSFMKENLLEKSNDQITFTPKRSIPDEALMTTDAQPPNLSVPARPNDMQRPRTLAEKRMILQQQNDIGILIIENESTVYHELKKRVRQGSSYDNALVRSIQDAEIPFTRDCWRAACWISTPNNRFFYRTIVYEGEEIKLTGSRGDNPKKVAFELKFDDKKLLANRSLKHILSECPQKCPPIGGIKINNIEAVIGDTNIRNDDPSQTKEKFGLLKKSRLCMFSREYLTPGPKSKKLKCKSNRKSSFDLEYGPLELVPLPTVQLEVWPQVGLPLSDHIKPLLKTIPTNSNVITPEWAKFAVSVVREAPKQTKHRRKYKKPEIERPEPIIFTIPYENNEKKILIRKRRRSSIVFNKNDTVNEHIESFYQDEDTNQLSFAKHVDLNDAISVECAEILTNMIESIAIAVNDMNFIKQDPDIDYIGKVISVSTLKESAKAASKAEKDKLNAKTEKTSKNKLIKELKRLNVTVIDTADEMAKSKKADEICQKPFCKFGCICASIDTAKYIQTHCQRPECMFECFCVNTPFKQGNPFYLNNSLDLLQARANACLAKEEKEFKSTIIVSENDMFVLPNSSTATKRSSKKPKRFTNDETYLEDTETEMIFKSKRRRPAEKAVEIRSTADRQRHILLKSLQHVRVEVKPLPELEVQPFCLVHCLYKCHCKGRAQRGRVFNFANKKNDIVGPGGWDVVSPRKRQYTFERDNNSISDEPLEKNRKTVIIPEMEDLSEYSQSSARTNQFNWKKRPRRTAQELKMLRNECMFAEDQKIDLLNERIMMCRKYNQAQNMLTKSMENGRLVSQAKSNALTNGHITTLGKPSTESLQRLNHFITDTMHRLTALQQRGRLSLNPTPNKLSIVSWDRMLQAFKSHEVFIWDVKLKNDIRLLVLTTTHQKPKSDNFICTTNINYAEDVNALPLIAKLLRNEYQTDKTKYLGTLLLRVTNFWRICGVLHSDLKYMDDELRVKPTPDQNPLLGRKINALYQLLTTREIPKTRPALGNAEPNASPEANGGTLSASIPSIECDSPPNAPNITPQNNKNDDDEVYGTPQKDKKQTKSYFENASMKLSLPIPVDSSQRLLMITLGDNFTHVWFPTWHKFLSAKRIQNSIHLSKKLEKAIEMSQKDNHPKVFVSNSHDNHIFIGPYGKTDRQNLALFVKHENHMWLSELYYKQVGKQFSRKTKASWIYPSSSHNGDSTQSRQTAADSSQLKINQVFSKHDLPSDLIISKPNSNDGEGASTSADPPVRSGFFTVAAMTNGSKTGAPKEGVSKSKESSPVLMSSKVFIPTKVVELPSNHLAKLQVIPNSNQNSDPLPLKISSVASGEEVTLMTNGFDDDDDDDGDNDEVDDDIDQDEINTQPQISEVKSLATGQDAVPKAGGNPSEIDQMGTRDLTGTILIETKTESIDISDDEQQINMPDGMEPHINSIAKEPLVIGSDSRLKGYMYCSTNMQLGKVSIEWMAPGRIKLQLAESIDVDCDESEPFQKNLASVSSYMNTYVRERFYGVYPAHLRLEWIFIKTDGVETCGTSLCDFNNVEPFSVVFKDKVVQISSDYQNDPMMPVKDIYVLDIYQLASQLFPEDAVKTMKISEILKESRKIDAELNDQQIKLKKHLAHYKKMVERYSNIFSKQFENQNGTVQDTSS